MADFPKTLSPLDRFERKLDFILDNLADPCDAPLTIWLQKIWKPLGELILAWYVVDLKNVFVAYLRPGLFAIEGRNNRHWGGGDKHKRHGKKMTAWQRLGTVVGWDPSEIIGKELWGADDLRLRPLPPGAAFLWIFEGVIERALFQWMVLDLGTEFIYNWMSAVNETKYCMARDDAVFLAECGPYPLLGIFGWDTQGSFHPLKMRNISFFNGFGVMADRGSGSAGGSAVIYSPPDGQPDGWIETRIRCTLGPSAGAETYEKVFIAPGSRVTVGAGCAVQSGDLIIFEIRVHGGMTMEKAHLFYQTTWVFKP